MGVVEKGEDSKLKCAVVLMSLHRSLEAQEPERAPFLHEAQAASGLKHPNVCTGYDFKEEGDLASAGVAIFYCHGVCEL